jgi:CHAD domain-containing protein
MTVKWISDLSAGTPVAHAARRVLSQRLEAVRDYLGRALRKPDKDPEHIHQLRVSSRRATAALEIFAAYVPEPVQEAACQKIRQVRRSAGAARDWDVFLIGLSQVKRSPRSRAVLDFLRGYAFAQRNTAIAQLQEACPDYPYTFERLLADTIAAVGEARGDPEATTLRELAGSQLSLLVHELDEAAARDLNDFAHLHEVRILGKRLRYAMEVFVDCFEPRFKEELYPAVQEMQDILGRANDSYVAVERLDELRRRVRKVLPEDWGRLKPGFAALIKQHKQRLPKERRSFLEWWHDWHTAGRHAALTAMLRRHDGQA